MPPMYTAFSTWELPASTLAGGVQAYVCRCPALMDCLVTLHTIASQETVPQGIT